MDYKWICFIGAFFFLLSFFLYFFLVGVIGACVCGGVFVRMCVQVDAFAHENGRVCKEIKWNLLFFRFVYCERTRKIVINSRHFTLFAWKSAYYTERANEQKRKRKRGTSKKKKITHTHIHKLWLKPQILIESFKEKGNKF